MTVEETVRALVERLRADEVVECELGTFFCVRYAPSQGRNPRTGEAVAVPAKRLPHFVPSEALLTAVGGPSALSRADLVEDLLREEVGVVSLSTGEPTEQDPDDAKDAVRVPPATATVSAPALFDAVVSRLAKRGPARVPGFGAFRRVAIRKGAHRGRAGVSFEAGMVLKAALQPEP